MGSRFNYNANMPSNCPHWNPGPGGYEAVSVNTGGKVEPGPDGPKPVFGKSQKLVSAEACLGATVFVSEVGHTGHSCLCVNSSICILHHRWRMTRVPKAWAIQ